MRRLSWMLVGLLVGCSEVAPQPPLAIRSIGKAEKTSIRFDAPLRTTISPGEKLEMAGVFQIAKGSMSKRKPHILIFKGTKGKVCVDQFWGYPAHQESGGETRFESMVTCPQTPGRYRIVASITTVPAGSDDPHAAHVVTDSSPVPIEVK